MINLALESLKWPRFLGSHRRFRPPQPRREAVHRRHGQLRQRRHQGGGRGPANLRHLEAVQHGFLQGTILNQVGLCSLGL